MSWGIRDSITRCGREGIVLLCSELGQPHLQCWGQLWVSQYQKDIKLLESIQRRATEMVNGLEGKPHEEQLRSLGLLSLEETEGRAHCSYNFPTKESGEAGTDLFSVVTNDRTQGKGLKLCQGRFRVIKHPWLSPHPNYAELAWSAIM